MADIAFTFGADAAASAGSTTITRAATYGAGETIAVYTQCRSDTITVTGVADGTHTFSLVHRRQEGIADTRTMELWEAHNVGAGSVTITVTFSASATIRGVGYFRGVNCDTTVGAQDGQGNFQTAAGAGTDAVTTGLMTPTSQPNGVLALACTYVNTVSLTAGTGYSNLGVLTAFNALNSDSSRIEFKRTTSTADVAGTFTAGGNDNIMSIGGVFTELVAGGAANPKGVFGLALGGPLRRVVY